MRSSEINEWKEAISTWEVSLTCGVIKQAGNYSKHPCGFHLVNWLKVSFIECRSRHMIVLLLGSTSTLA